MDSTARRRRRNIGERDIIRLDTNKDRKKKPCLLSFKELPEYMKDNEYIKGSYRVEWSLKDAFHSLFSWHNETLNVWTHLLGFFLFVALTMTNVTQVPQMADIFNSFTRPLISNEMGNISHNAGILIQGVEALIMDRNLSKATESAGSTVVTRWPFFVFLGGSMFCLLSSSLCHLFCCHSHSLTLLLLRLDYAGIAVMIITSFFPPIYYLFLCDRHWQLIYLGSITLMGVATLMTLLSPVLSTSRFRWLRALLFSTMGLSGMIPALHAIILHWNEPRRNIALLYETAMSSSYLIGTLFYVTRIPERWKPGHFDLTGHSHQIFHVFVVTGALAHYGAGLIFVDWRSTVGCS